MMHMQQQFMTLQFLTLSWRFSQKLQNHLLSLLRFSSLQNFSQDDGVKLASGRQTILCFPSFEEKEKQKDISYSAYNRRWHQKDGITLSGCNIGII